LYTRSYKILLESSDEKSKVNRLIRSRPDFTLAYNAPTDGESEEYNLWESKLRKLYNEFTDIRAPHPSKICGGGASSFYVLN
jgi:hypothetical protein